MNDPETCELLPWDSTFFNRKIARVRGDVLTVEVSRKIDHYAFRQKIDLLYLLARADDQKTVELAQAGGYELVDVRMTFEQQLYGSTAEDIASDAIIRPAAAADQDALITMARQSHRTTRFYYDSHIPQAKADDLYAAWMVRDLKGDVLVAERDGRIIGYNTFSLDAQRQCGSIGLTAVGEGHRGAGIGHALMVKAIASLQQRRAAKVTVVTQGRNLPAQRLYTRCGFIPSNLQLYYHRWFNSD